MIDDTHTHTLTHKHTPEGQVVEDPGVGGSEAGGQEKGAGTQPAQATNCNHNK